MTREGGAQRPKRKPKHEGASTETLADRRKSANIAMHKIGLRQALTNQERFVVTELLMLVVRGEDARKYLGIAPKRGAKGKLRARDVFLAADYWIRKPQKDAIVLPIIAARWRISESRVVGIVNEKKASAMSLIAMIDKDVLLQHLEHAIESLPTGFAKSPI